MNIFLESELGMALGTTLGESLVSIIVPSDVFLGGNGDGKTEDSCLGETMVEVSSDVCLCGSGERSTLVKSLISEDGDELCFYGDISGGESLDSEDGAELGYPGGRISGEESEGIVVCDPGGVLNGKSSENLGENPLGGVLGAENGLIIW